MPVMDHYGFDEFGGWEWSNGALVVTYEPQESSTPKYVTASCMAMIRRNESPIIGVSLRVVWAGILVHQSEHRSTRGAQKAAHAAIRVAEELRRYTP
jgi:hypothetical protein